MRKFFWQKTVLILIVIATANIPLLWQIVWGDTILKSIMVVFIVVAFIYINIFPYLKEKYTRKRLRIMIGGEPLF